MKRFAELLDTLYFTNGNLAKAEVLKRYLREAPDPDRGWAVAALGGTLSFDLFKRNLVVRLIATRVDPVLFELSYEYVGETSETVAHLWPDGAPLAELPSLGQVVARFHAATKTEVGEYLAELLDAMTPRQRWALLKLGTRSLRVGVSARFLKRVLADFGGQPVELIEKLWHGLEPPYVELLQWLDGAAPMPDTRARPVFHPVMLAHPLEASDFARISPHDYQAEWKYDGIRVQLVSTPRGRAIFSRSGDDIGGSFPDLLERLDANAVIDGELLIKRGDVIESFNELQQRLGRKQPSKKLQQQYPAHVIAYDAVALDGRELTAEPLSARRVQLAEWLRARGYGWLSFSEELPFADFEALTALRASAATVAGPYVEGLMLKRRASLYIPGRPKGEWYKWKRSALTVDAVVMYAQRGTGKRSSFYSDYTFGLWHNGELAPIGKAYSGFTDAELKQLDSWVRNNTIGRFGPVRELKKELVFEVAFDGAQASARHKSGLALRFPRIARIRWDKPAAEADQLDQFKRQVGLQ